MGDTAYGAATVAAALQAMAPDTALVAPVPPANNRTGLFPKTAFTVDADRETVTCPAGQTVAYGARRPRRDGTRGVRWAAATCQACPLQTQCVDGMQPRSLTIRPDEAAIQAQRQIQATVAWAAHYRERSRVEHVQAQQARHGGRHGRYWGPRKLLFQERLVAAACNLVELARIAAVRTRPAPPPGPWRSQCV